MILPLRGPAILLALLSASPVAAAPVPVTWLAVSGAQLTELTITGERIASSKFTGGSPASIGPAASVV